MTTEQRLGDASPRDAKDCQPLPEAKRGRKQILPWRFQKEPNMWTL